MTKQQYSRSKREIEAVKTASHNNEFIEDLMDRKLDELELLYDEER